MTSARKTKIGKEISFCTSLGVVQPLTEKQVGTGAEIHSAIASGIVTGVAPVSYRPFFFLVSSYSSRDLCESNSSQFPFRFTILQYDRALNQDRAQFYQLTSENTSIFFNEQQSPVLERPS